MSIFRFNPHDSVVIIEAIISAKSQTVARLVVDTGASRTMIPKRLAKAIGLKIDPKRTIQTITATKVDSSPITIVPMITVLDKTVKNVEALVKDLPKESLVDGLLGLSFLKNFKLSIDFKKIDLNITIVILRSSYLQTI